MEKDRFLLLVKNYTSLSEEEAVELDHLQNDFPFSQVIHNLAARAAQDNQLDSHDKLLRISAVYATDRTVLKQLMTEPRSAKTATPAVSIPEYVDEEKVTTKFSSKTESGLSGDDLINEIAIDLKKLKELRHNFEVSMEEYENAHPATPPKKKNKKANEPKPEEIDTADGLIEEIRSTKKEIGPEGDRQKEQIEIINQFIKTSPIIGKGKSVASSEDLTEPSNDFSDHIISETLVDILLKQGKKDKAIEVLRKLIWKFPQKKAIFAAQIETLKK